MFLWFYFIFIFRIRRLLFYNIWKISYHVLLLFGHIIKPRCWRDMYFILMREMFGRIRFSISLINLRLFRFWRILINFRLWFFWWWDIIDRFLWRLFFKIFCWWYYLFLLRVFWIHWVFFHNYFVDAFFFNYFWTWIRLFPL